MILSISFVNDLIMTLCLQIKKNFVNLELRTTAHFSQEIPLAHLQSYRLYKLTLPY